MKDSIRLKALAVIACLTLAIPALTGCASADGQSTASLTSSAPSVPLSEAEFLDNPKTFTGPSTAIAVTTAIRPVAENPTPNLPVTITDNQGTKVTVTDVSRILALDLYGSTSRIVFELGLGGNLVGRDASSSYPEIIDLPLVTGNAHQLTAEAILELAPTVIIADTTLGPWDVILQMRDAGIPVVVVDSHRNLDNIGTLIQQVADGLGVTENGQILAARTENEVEQKLAEIAAVVPADPADRLRIVFLYMRGNAGVYYMFGKDSGADALIESVGGIDVSAEIGWQGMRPLTDEGLIAAQPDAILMMTSGLESVGGIDGLLEQVPAVAQTPAGQNRRIIDMSDTEVLSFGPNTAAVLDALTRAIYAPESQ